VLVIFLSALWITGFSVFSFLPKDGSFQAFYPFAKMSYGRVCHQNSNKSFLINGYHFLVCSRCTGIYIGAFFGILSAFFPLEKYFTTVFKYFIFFSLLLLADVLLNNFVFTFYNKTSAFFTGYLFSFFAANFVILELKRNNFLTTIQRDL